MGLKPTMPTSDTYPPQAPQLKSGYKAKRDENLAQFYLIFIEFA